jgi:hypothetical protein
LRPFASSQLSSQSTTLQG